MTTITAGFVLASGIHETQSTTTYTTNDKKRFIQVQLLGVNDFHGQLNVTRQFNGRDVGRADYLASYLKERKEKNKNTLLVHVGDMVGASAPVSSLINDVPTIELLNKLGFDLGILGNHEFDQGKKEMMRLIQGGFHQKTGYFEGAQFPYICANVINLETSKPILPPYKIAKFGGIPIGFIGIVLDETPTMVNSSAIEGITFIDEVTAINNAAAELKEQGVKAIIVLAHNSGRQSAPNDTPTGEIVEMSKRIDDEVDVLFAGHSHTYLNTVVDGKLLVQAYSYGTAFSDIDLEIDPVTKDVVSKQAEIVMTYQDSIKPDKEIKKVIEKYEAEVDSVVNEIVGTAENDITSTKNENGESALGNLIADSQRTMMNTDFAFMNPGGIRADIPSGKVTYESLLTTLPFHFQLVKMTLTGDQIHRLLNQQWQENQVRMLQISGLKYTWGTDKAAGNKVVDIFDSDGSSIQPEKNYTVTVNSYLAAGGDNFTVLLEGKNKVAGPFDIDVLKNYVIQHKQTFTSYIDGRIAKIN
ncbi:bifunctional UDP-sugar hydrolase/5'-nucleotidase [Neobacillus mesonae]|uniref:bifunctional metallophosphatase/5'-nucleotidase n=1 Tax=Neobacillus mesonae TaxID=1193713 RepID=UPI002040F488|nr:5'-nucleotidase C-terminal domain-containing protein [Neobacillus mesonae]MCM3570138.1 5'-nucleotidase C-terminal domain-containing protein [Neobacillus mesonae]